MNHDDPPTKHPPPMQDEEETLDKGLLDGRYREKCEGAGEHTPK